MMFVRGLKLICNNYSTKVWFKTSLGQDLCMFWAERLSQASSKQQIQFHLSSLL